MDREKGLLELVEEANGGKNIMFKDRRSGNIMALASTLNLINKDLELQAQYEIRGKGSETYIKSKQNVENLE
jgi:hypothetical protein